MLTVLLPVANCPFCHSEAAGLIDAEEYWCGARVVACDACGAQGPTGIDDQSAIELWNQRAREGCAP